MMRRKRMMAKEKGSRFGRLAPRRERSKLWRTLRRNRKVTLK